MVPNKQATQVRHNIRMLPGSSVHRVMTVPLISALAALLVLSGCSSPSKSESTETPGATGSVSESPSPSASASEPPAPYLKVPDGVVLTQPGFALKIGEQATVAWELPVAEADKGGKKDKKNKNKKNKRPVAAIKIKIKKVEAATLKAFAGWELNKAARNSNPFFVHSAVTNVGKTDLSGVKPPLYIVDGNNTLIQASTFEGDFKPCASTPFPKKFKPGEKIKMCSVYLSPKNGRLTAVSFRPTPKFNPITWTGETVPYQEPKKKKKGKKNDEDQ